MEDHKPIQKCDVCPPPIPTYQEDNNKDHGVGVRDDKPVWNVLEKFVVR